MQVALDKLDAGHVVQRDRTDEVLGEPVLADRAAAESRGVDHQRVAGEQLGADIVVALDAVFLCASGPLRSGWNSRRHGG